MSTRLYEQRARAAVILAVLSILMYAACLLTLVQIPDSPTFLWIWLIVLLSVSAVMFGLSVGAWWVNRKEGT